MSEPIRNRPPATITLDVLWAEVDGDDATSVAIDKEGMREQLEDHLSKLEAEFGAV